jgi:hypothetical protein
MQALSDLKDVLALFNLFLIPGLLWLRAIEKRLSNLEGYIKGKCEVKAKNPDEGR